ncbi:flagellin [Methylobacterium currus]|uniref:Flagellin n=1 Tax=Methylobacterium currus TaxID=2051553 RepID=A0A2R4WKN0_9HYPH|nr:flagellin [Methylobacterium currus]AWB22076.1 flagellin [Methylobacterium currus]
MTSLLTNNAAMIALTTIKSINNRLDVTSNRVSTGQRVSAASDNAAYWSIATTVRTDNTSLSAIKDSLGLGSSAVDTAYNGLNAIIADLRNIRAKLQSALTPGVDRAKVQAEISAIQSKMKATADSSNAGGLNWLSVDLTSTGRPDGATQKVVAGFSRDANGNITFSTVNIDVDAIKLYAATAGAAVAEPATAALVVGSTALAGTSAFSGGTADFATATAGMTKQVSLVIDLGGGASATIQLDKDTLKSSVKDLAAVTIGELLAAINNQIAASGPAKLGGKVIAGLDSAGRLTLTTVATGAAVSLKVGMADPTDAAKFTAADIGFGASSGAVLTASGTVLTASRDYAPVNVFIPERITLVEYSNGVYLRNHIISLDIKQYTRAGTAVSSYPRRLSADDAITMINRQLGSQGGGITAGLVNGRIVFNGAAAGPNISLGIDHNMSSGANSFGFDLEQTAAGTDVATATGTAATTTAAKGILDTNTGTYASSGGGSYSVANFDISTLVGSSGDADVSAILTMVDKAITKVTDAGTKLGASKTQIDGQKSFVDTLMKVNNRTIGTLVDADIEEESMKLKALQTQQQLAVQSLSIANAASQTVLSLFR